MKEIHSSRQFVRFITWFSIMPVLMLFLPNQSYSSELTSLGEVTQLPPAWQSYDSHELAVLYRDLVKIQVNDGSLEIVLGHVRELYIDDLSYLMAVETDELIRFVGDWSFLFGEEKRQELGELLIGRLTDDAVWAKVSTEDFERFLLAAGHLGMSRDSLERWVHTWMAMSDTWKQADPVLVARLLVLEGLPFKMQYMPGQAVGGNLSVDWDLLISHTVEIIKDDPLAIDTIVLSYLFNDVWRRFTDEQRDVIRLEFINSNTNDTSSVTDLAQKEFHQLLIKSHQLGVLSEQRAEWLDAWVVGNGSWKEEETSSLAWLLGELSQSPEYTNEAWSIVSSHLLSRIQDNARELDAIVLLPGFKNILGSLGEAEANELREEFTKLHIHGGSVFADLTFGELHQLLIKADRLGIPESTQSGWQLDWVNANDQWQAYTPLETVNLLRRLDQHGPAQKHIVDHTLRRLQDNPKWLAEAAPTPLLRTLHPLLDDDQYDAMRHVLSEGLVSNSAAWQGLTLAHFERLRQIGRQLGIPAARRAEWLRDWILLGEGWESEGPYTLALVLRMLDESDEQTDMSVARARLIDRIISQAQHQPGWLDDAVSKHYAGFIVYTAQALKLDTRYRERDATAHAIASLLNATGPMVDDRSETRGPGSISEYQLRQAWYNSYQMHACGGSPSWGEGSSDQTSWIVDLIYAGLDGGSIEPRPTTLYLLGWHFEGAGALVGWNSYLEQEIANHKASDDEAVVWLLLGRAYTEEISSVSPNPTAGKSWLLKAIDRASSDKQRMQIVSLLAMKYAAGGELIKAEALLDEWSEAIDLEIPGISITQLRHDIYGVDTSIRATNR